MRKTTSLFLFLMLCFTMVTYGQTAPAADSGSSGDESDSSEQVDVAPETGSSVTADSAWHRNDRIHAVSGDRVNQMKQDPDFAYANDSEYWQQKKTTGTTVQSPRWNDRLFEGFLILVVAALGIWGLVMLARENGFSWVFRKKAGITGESADSQPLPEPQFEEVISQYQDAKDYRLAVRFLYLRMLDGLKERGDLTLRSSSTNAEIARLLGSHPMAEEFRFLSRSYEYAFYGGFVPTPENYHMLRKRFDLLQQKFSV